MPHPDTKPLRDEMIGVLQNATDDEFMMYAMAILGAMEKVVAKRKATAAERDGT